jgi:hypothetical protein
MTLKVAVDRLPLRAIAVQFTAVVPTAKVLPDAGRQVTTGLGSIASLAVTAYVTGAPADEVAVTVSVPGTFKEGCVRSILIVTDTDFDKPAPLLAVQDSVVPEVVTFRVVGPQPEEDAIPESGSVTLHCTVALLRYHPLLPLVPTT